MTKAYTYILECSDGSYYTGSTVDLETRINQHQDGQGANHTKKRLPVKVVYVEEFLRIDDAFYREKQIQGWSRKKKEALIEKNFDSLPELSECQNESHCKNVVSTPLNHQQAPSEDVTSPNKKDSTTVAERSRSYKSNGKLLLTGEYVVLDGVVALAIPTKYGQSLRITPIETHKIYWKSFDDQKNIWFETEFDLEFILTSKLTEIHPNTANSRLQQILCAARMLNPEFLSTNSGFKIETYLDFPKNWGLGTSSTLINNVAQWAHVDAFKLLKLTFGGSGYDIACAQNNVPITYRLEKGKPTIKQVHFNPPFAEHLYFVYLNKKQNSRDGIAHYKALQQDLKPIISEINTITEEMIACKDVTTFEKLIETHEHIISKTIQQPTVKSLYFNDFKGAIKSLGAWGGDFIMVSSKTDPSSYFKNKGFNTVIPYNDMVLK